MKTFYAMVREKNNRSSYHMTTRTCVSKKACKEELNALGLVVRSIYTKEQLDAKIAKDLAE